MLTPVSPSTSQQTLESATGPARRESSGWRLVNLGLLCAIGLSVLSAFWFEHPVVIGGYAVRVLLLREAVVLTGILALAVTVFRRIWSGDTTVVRPDVPVSERDSFRIALLVAGVAMACYAIALPFRFDLFSGSGYLSQLQAAPPLDLFLPRGIWTIADMVNLYRPVAMIVPSVVMHVIPDWVIVVGVCIHAANAGLLSRVSLIVWPGNARIALVAGVVAACLPVAVDTVLNPYNQGYLLLGFFCLLAIVAVDASLRYPHRRGTLLLLASLSFLCALLSNELAVTLPFVLVGMVALSRPSDQFKATIKSTLGPMFATLGLFLIFYAGYLWYAAHNGHASRTSLLWPLNVKRIVLSLAYMPVWSFLFPYEEIVTPRELAGSGLWLIPLLAGPLFCVARLRLWRDWRFALASLMALTTIGPAANFFEMQITWGNERQGYLAFLLLCVPYAYVIHRMATAPGSPKARWLHRVWAAGALAGIVALFGVQMALFNRMGTLAGRVARAIEGQASYPAQREVHLLNLGRDTCTFAGTGYVLTAVWARARALLPGVTVHLNGAGCEATVSRPVASATMPTIEVSWEHALMAGASGSRTALAYWDDANGRLNDVTEAVRQKMNAPAGPARSEMRELASGEGLSRQSDGWLLQRTRRGELLLKDWNSTPGREDVMVLRLALAPVGLGQTSLNFLDIQWSGEIPEGLVPSVAIPVLTDGIEREYRIRLGTSVTWLATGHVRDIRLRTPPYPVRIRLSRVERVQAAAEAQRSASRPD